MNKTIGIYVIENNIDHKVYVGSSSECEKRIVDHCRNLEKGSHHSRHLQRAWNVRGKEAFEFRIVERVADANFLLPRERFWIIRTRCCDQAFGYNTLEMPDRLSGFKHSDETRARLSISTRRAYAEGKMKNRKKPHWSAESREKLARLRRETPVSDEARRKRSEASCGKPHSADWNSAISAANLGKVLSQEHKNAVSAGLRRYWAERAAR